ncbi:MAG: type VI secretion system baseplate subunit TssG, partial [Aeromonas veronii]
MASPDRSALPDVSASNEAPRFNFFQLGELLNRLDGADQERGLDHLPSDENIRFKATASLGFPTSDVLQIGRDEKGRHELEV